MPPGSAPALEMGSAPRPIRIIYGEPSEDLQEAQGRDAYRLGDAIASPDRRVHRGSPAFRRGWLDAYVASLSVEGFVAASSQATVDDVLAHLIPAKCSPWDWKLKLIHQFALMYAASRVMQALLNSGQLLASESEAQANLDVENLDSRIVAITVKHIAQYMRACGWCAPSSYRPLVHCWY